MVYSALHTVLMSWGDVRPAVTALAEARQSETWAVEEISATATNTLQALGHGGPRSQAAAWRYFDALILHDIVDVYHINTMLGLCDSASEVDKVLAASAQIQSSSAAAAAAAAPEVLDRCSPAASTQAQELTHEIANRAWLRLGDVEQAASALVDASAVAGGWGGKKRRRKVVAGLRKLYDEAEHDPTVYDKAVAYFFALHGRGLTDQHSCKLALKRCHAEEEEALRHAIEAAGY